MYFFILFCLIYCRLNSTPCDKLLNHNKIHEDIAIQGIIHKTKAIQTCWPTTAILSIRLMEIFPFADRTNKKSVDGTLWGNMGALYRFVSRED